jgi:Flp pilus assembly protein TadD
VAPSRIDDLRRRVEADPASIAFAQLAEEYRRAGQTEEAVRVSREGLTRHPGYLSARVTLGRALLDLGQLDEARIELQFVASEAPENLAAVRGLAEIFHREGDAAAALEHFQRALALARHDPELEEIVQQLSRQVGAESAPSNGLSFEEAHQELLSAADRLPEVAPAPPTEDVPADGGGATAPFNFDTLVAALGTPAAPPIVEAVSRGEDPPVFELPEVPDLGADPFAALEAELRHQVDPSPSGVQAGESTDSDEPGPLSPWPQAVPDPQPDAVDEPADPSTWSPNAPAVAAIETAAPADEVVEVVETAVVVEATPVPDEPMAIDEPPVPTLSDWTAAMPGSAPAEPEEAVAPYAVETEPAFVEPDPSWAAREADDVARETSEAPLAAADIATSSGGSEAEGPASTSLVAVPQREGIDAMADQAEETPAAPAGNDDASSPAPASSGAAPAAKDDGVLDELEDWLNSLQDRSGQ